jgi:hypothetical protein
MDAALLIGAIGVAVLIAVLYSLRQSSLDTGTAMQTQKSQFIIGFAKNQWSPAVRVEPDGNPQKIVDAFSLLSPRPTIFITGGASSMSEEDIQQTRILIEEGIAAFAQKHRISVIDGGTEAGVMEMIGTARMKHNYNFPLIGVAPVHKVSWPGYTGRSSESTLQAGHSHFVLVESDEWGGESNMIVGIAKTIAAQKAPIVGILINGGKIAEREVYLASSHGEVRMPIVIIDGSGRTADKISTAYKTQQTDNALIKAIIKGADIRITALDEGVPALISELEKIFGKEPKAEA